MIIITNKVWDKCHEVEHNQQRENDIGVGQTVFERNLFALLFSFKIGYILSMPYKEATLVIQ